MDVAGAESASWLLLCILLHLECLFFGFGILVPSLYGRDRSFLME